MPLIKTLSQTLKQDKEKFKVPKSVQQAIPIRKIWPDGIFQVESKYSRTFRFTDINYSIASKADKTEMFLDYSELLNALDSGCTAKITLNNRKINKEEFEQSLLIPMKGDGLDEYRKEYNDMLLSKISGTNNSIYQERYLTISVHKKTSMKPEPISHVWERTSSPIWPSCPLLGKSWMQSRGYRSSGTFSRQTFHRVFHLT